ncbi:MAG: hypothetical protein JNK15_19390 [Planctomycetes bacterium]|nr:hypothetical protein [Planctomycetota bacterium]
MATGFAVVSGSVRVLAGVALAAVALAQSPVLDGVAVPGRVEVRLDGAAPSAIAAWFVSASVGVTPLPWGGLLELEAPEWLAIALADEHGSAHFASPFLVGQHAGIAVHSQVLVWDPAVPLTTSGAVVATPRHACTVPAPGAPADVFVLFGQSNAEGHADGASLPARFIGARPRARIWVDGANAFVAMQHGANTRSYGPANWCGPELSLADELAGEDGTVHLVKFALPATALGDTPGPWNEWGAPAQELYAILRYRIGAACAAMRAQGLEPRVRGIFMVQGESDCTDEFQARSYRANLTELVHTFRQDLVAAGDANVPDVPFVLATVDQRLPAWFFPHVASVRAAQRVVARSLPRCAAVATEHLGMQPDGVHFTGSGVVQLGKDLAAAWRTFAP